MLSDLEGFSFVGVLVGFLFCIGPLQVLARARKESSKIPISSTGGLFRSRFLSNLSFAKNALGVINDGYQSFSEKAFQFLRSDGDVVVLPPSAVQELSSLPPHIADGTKALEHDLLGSYTGLDFILESRLHHRVVQRKITPNLASLTPLLEDELNQGVQDLLPQESGEEWITVQLYPLLLALTARTSARAFVGTGFCRNKDWLDVAVNFVEDLFRTVVILRAFPSWLHPVVSRLIPSYWRGKNYFRKAVSILGPYIQSRLDGTPPTGVSYDMVNEPCALNWLVDIADESERNKERIAHTETVLSLAGIHTMLLRQLSVVYDMTAHPQYIEELRHEIADVANEGWSRSSYSKLRKLDSFMRESQRLAPPTVLGMKRIMEQPYTLQDGTQLSKGSYVCVAAYQIENDPKHTPNPEKFDGLRSFNAPETQRGSAMHSFASTEPTVLGFGHGKTACPGRHFASLVIKMSIVKLLSEYEFSFLPGTERPQNWVAHEFLFAFPWDRVRMRKRPSSICPF